MIVEVPELAGAVKVTVAVEDDVAVAVPIVGAPGGVAADTTEEYAAIKI